MQITNKLCIEFLYARSTFISVFWDTDHPRAKNSWALHFLPKRSWQVWGYAVEPYDHCLDYYGLGPLFLLVRIP